MISADLAPVVPAAALLVTWAVLRLLLRRPELFADIPNERSLHSRAVPRTGGIAIMAGAFATGLWVPDMLPFVMTAAAIAIVSLVDDWRTLRIGVRLTAHVLGACALVWIAFKTSGAAEAVLLVLTLVWLANLYNFMDGSDGLAGGMAVFGFSAYAVAAWVASDWPLAAFSAAIACSAFVFLLYNFHPARLFMGDAGSVTLGFLAGGLGIGGWQSGTWPVLFPVVVFSPFIVDATLTLIRRIARGEKFWRPHREHFYQKLVRLGLGHRRTALVEYVAMLFSCLAAAALLNFTTSAQIAAGTAWLLVLLGAAAFIERRWQAHVVRSSPA
jgi:UDP-N-acetylmuramyl pentapeptide phosphotransferase/UDP-N-acetylglucosamine-1-phosphate transferase